MKPIDMSKDIVGTYMKLRFGVAFIAIALPLLLWIGGYVMAKLSLQGSMSAYYYAGNGAMRNELVGILFAVGTILFLYKGFTRLEDYALNLAGVLAVGIALFPMSWPPDPSKDSLLSLHGIFAVSFFVCVAYVCIFRASDTLPLVTDAAERERYRRVYKALGVAMVASPAIAFIFTSVPPLQSVSTFFIEAAGVWVFSAYWLVKSHEISQTSADEKASCGKLHIKTYGLSDAFRPLPITPVDE
jgi:hypothetical protein